MEPSTKIIPHPFSSLSRKVLIWCKSLSKKGLPRNSKSNRSIENQDQTPPLQKHKSRAREETLSYNDYDEISRQAIFFFFSFSWAHKSLSKLFTHFNMQNTARVSNIFWDIYKNMQINRSLFVDFCRPHLQNPNPFSSSKAKIGKEWIWAAWSIIDHEKIAKNYRSLIYRSAKKEFQGSPFFFIFYS